MAILRFHDMINMINNSVGHISKLEYWQNFVHEMFTPNASLRYSKSSTIDFRQFDFLISLVPLLFVTLWKLGVVRIEVSPQQLKSEVLSNGCIFISCPRATFTYHYPDGSYITHFVQFKGIFTPGLKLEFGDLCMHSFVPGIEWNSLERLLSNQDASFEIFQKLSQLNNDNSNKDDKSNESINIPTPNNTNSSKSNANTPSTNPNHGDGMNKPGIDGENDKNIPPNFNAITQLRSYFSVFRNVSVFGSQEGLMRVMQVSTVMSALKNLRVYQKTHNINSPLEALNSYVQQNYTNPNVGMTPMSNNGTGPNTNTAGSPAYDSNPNVNQTPNTGNNMNNPNNNGGSGNTPQVHSSYMSTTPSVNSSYAKRALNTQDNRLNNDKKLGTDGKRRRQSGVSPHSLRDTLSPNNSNNNPNDNDDYGNARKKQRN